MKVDLMLVLAIGFVSIFILGCREWLRQQRQSIRDSAGYGTPRLERHFLPLLGTMEFRLPAKGHFVDCVIESCELPRCSSRGNNSQRYLLSQWLGLVYSLPIPPIEKMQGSHSILGKLLSPFRRSPCIAFLLGCGIVSALHPRRRKAGFWMRYALFQLFQCELMRGIHKTCFSRLVMTFRIECQTLSMSKRSTKTIPFSGLGPQTQELSNGQTFFLPCRLLASPYITP